VRVDRFSTFLPPWMMAQAQAGRTLSAIMEIKLPPRL
jgi:hypothetical protein